MLKLILLRHAKAGSHGDIVGDIHRPLNERGKAASIRMGQFLKDESIRAEQVLCSPALRARQTWELVSNQLNDVPTWRYEEDFYDFSGAAAYAKAITRHGGDAQTLMIVGHNPSIGELADALAASGSEHDLERLRTKYPTAALAEIDLELDAWTGINMHTGVLKRFVCPRDFDDKP